MATSTKKDRTVKLQDVANRANVSLMAVSLCLRSDGGEGRMAPATRERILSAVSELGYRPNALAQALRLGRSNVVALYAGHGFLNVRSAYFTEIVSGLQEGCEITKKDLLLQGTFHTAKSGDILPELMNGRIDGLVVDMYPNDLLRPQLVNSGLPVIAISNEIEGIPSIVVDDIEGSKMIAEHLHGIGHRRVTYVAGEVEPLSGLKRRIAFWEAAGGLGIQCTLVRTLTNELTHGWIRDAMALGITALVCWNDTCAREILETLLEMGIDVPRQLAVTGFDGCPVHCIEKYPLTTVAAPWSEVARSSVLSLNARLAGEDVPARTVHPVRFVRGATS